MNVIAPFTTWDSGACRLAPPSKRRQLHWLVGVALTLAAGVAHAQCSVSASGLDFAGYDVFAATHNDSTATITVSCSEATGYSLALSSAHGSTQQPVLSSSNDALHYHLHQDAARSLKWGEGSFALGGSADGTEAHTVYGRIPAGQNVRVGNYTDTITVTLEF